MRYSYLLPRCVILAMLWTFFAFSFDPIVRHTVVTSSQSALGAKVEIGTLETTLSPLSLVAKQVQVANRYSPGKNLVEFEELRIHAAGGPLLKKSCVIDEGSLTGLRFGTPRADDGKVDGSLSLPAVIPKWIDSFERSIAAAGQESMALLVDRAKHQLDPRQLETVRLSQQLNADWRNRFANWETRVKRFETRTKQIQNRAGQVKGNQLERIETYAEIASKTNDLLREAKALRNDFRIIPDDANRDLQLIDEARKRDQQAIARKVENFRIDSETLTRFLLGPDFQQRLEEALGWIEWTRTAFPDITDPIEPKRLRGRDIVFRRVHEVPDFLIKRLSVAGTAQIDGYAFPYQGVVSGLTSDPTVYGQPVVIHLDGGGDDGNFQLDAVVDHTQSIPVYRVALNYTDSNTSVIALGTSNSLPLRLRSARTDYLATLEWSRDHLFGRLSLRQQPVRIDLADDFRLESDTQRQIAAVLGNVRSIESQLLISGTPQDPNWRLQSDLGEQLSNGFNSLLVEQIATKQQALESQIDIATRQELDKLHRMLSDRYSGLLSKLNRNETAARQLIDRVADGRSLDWKKLLRR